MRLEISSKIHYLIYFAEYPFDLWRNIDISFGVHKEENDNWRKSITSSNVLSQYVLASIVSDEIFHDEEVANSTQQITVVTIMFHSNASFAYQEADIEEPSFSLSLEVEDTDSSSFDVVNEEEVTNGDSFVEYSLTHLVFSMSSIMDFEIHIPHFHTYAYFIC